MQGLSRRAVVGTVVLCPVMALGSVPAHAERPAVDRRSCEAVGGVFAKDRGTRSCTEVELKRLEGPVLTRSVRIEGGPRTGPSLDMIGTYRVVRVVETTTTRSQRGREIVVRSEERELSSVVEPLTCRRALADLPEPRPTVEDTIPNCAAAGVYPA